ncbi:MAG: ChaN family lipoprotein [Proteobacteria bacterium]|nr:ChaN family lipoprotein [Pseudomonadota bacterium]
MTLAPGILFSLLLFVLGSCAWVEQNVAQPTVENLAALTAGKPAWKSPVLQQHHLVGRIWRPSDGRFVDQQALTEDLVRSAYILLGEKHDNPDHHLLQARLIHTLTALGRRPAVVWEMILESRQPVLDSYWAKYSHDAAALGGTLGWDASGWPAWSMYQPIAEAAMAAHLPMYAAGLSKAAVRTLARGKPSFAFAKRQRSLGLNIPMPEEMRQRSLEQLYQGHCELMPRDALVPLLNVQRAKDAVFAEHMLSGGADDGTLLIAGTGHVRKDLAVPVFLARHQPDVRITTVAFVEVRDGILDPMDYAASFSAPVLPFDYVWFTPRADDKDHCAALKEKWRKPKDVKMDPAAGSSTDTSRGPSDAPAEPPSEAPAEAPSEVPTEVPAKTKPVPQPTTPPAPSTAPAAPENDPPAPNLSAPAPAKSSIKP